MVGAVDKNRQNIDIQGLRQLEGTLVETLDVARHRARTFGINHHRIASLDQRSQSLHVFVIAIRNRIKLSKPDNYTIHWVFPDPIGRQQDHLGVEHHRAKQIKVRLVVGDDDGRLLKGLAILVIKAELHARQGF